MGVFNNRRRRKPILNHLQAARQMAEGTWPTGEASHTAVDNILRHATMPGEALKSEIFDPADAARDSWREVQETAQEAFLAEVAYRAEHEDVDRALVDAPAVVEKPVEEPTSPPLRPRHTRDQLAHADLVAKAYLRQAGL